MRAKTVNAILIAAMLAVAVSCGMGTNHAQLPMRAFPEIQIPSIYDNDEAVAGYAAQHWWDAFLTKGEWYSDSLTVNGVSYDNIVMAMGAYAECISSIPVKDAAKALARLHSQLEEYMKTDSSSYAYNLMVDLVGKYLYDPNSPYRNEDIYLPFVKAVAESELTPEDMRAGYAHTAKMCAMNQYGTKVPDFRFKDIGGKVHDFYDTKAEHVLLFFSNPGCYACRGIIEKLNGMKGVGEMIADGRLAIVNIYIDEQLDEWKEYQTFYPKNWYNGYNYDLAIRNELLYDVRAIPSLYLLDSEKRVIMRDAPEERVFEWLEHNQLH